MRIGIASRSGKFSVSLRASSKRPSDTAFCARIAVQSLFRRFRQTTRWLDRATSPICSFDHQSALQKFANLRVFNLGNFSSSAGVVLPVQQPGSDRGRNLLRTSLWIPLRVIAMRVLEGVPKSRASAFEQILHFPLEPSLPRARSHFEMLSQLLPKSRLSLLIE